MRCVTGIALAFFLLQSSGAGAQDAATAFEHYRTGDYEGAISIGEASNTGPGLAVAARAAFAEANLRDTPCLTCLKRVEDLARRSIMLDMNHPEAFVYLAAALGYESRIIGYVRATVEHYPEQAKQAIDRALADNPNDAWSLAALGGWHLEIVRNGGGFLARTLYGAHEDAGQQAFARAFAADPGNLVVRFQYVMSMSALDLKRRQKDISDQLAAIALLEPRTSYEAVIKQRAARLMQLLSSGAATEYLALVKRFQGYPAA